MERGTSVLVLGPSLRRSVGLGLLGKERGREAACGRPHPVG